MEQHFQKAIQTSHVSKKKCLLPAVHASSYTMRSLCVCATTCRSMSNFDISMQLLRLLFGPFHHQNLTELDAVVPKKMRRVVG